MTLPQNTPDSYTLHDRNREAYTATRAFNNTDPWNEPWILTFPGGTETLLGTTGKALLRLRELLALGEHALDMLPVLLKRAAE